MKTAVRFAVALMVLSAVVGSSTVAQALPSPVACDTTKGRCWHPGVGERWQYQLQGVAAYPSTGGINVNISAVPFTGGAAVKPTCSTSISTRIRRSPGTTPR